jgi:hypothetical protein
MNALLSIIVYSPITIISVYWRNTHVCWESPPEPIMIIPERHFMAITALQLTTIPRTLERNYTLKAKLPGL